MFAHIAAWWNQESMIVRLFVCMLVFDVVLGTGRALVEHKLNSGVSRRGVFRKVVMLILVAFTKTFARESGMPLVELTVVFFIKTELESIVENMALVGIPMPPALTKFFSLLPPYDDERDVSRKTEYKLKALEASDGARIEV